MKIEDIPILMEKTKNVTTIKSRIDWVQGHIDAWTSATKFSGYTSVSLIIGDNKEASSTFDYLPFDTCKEAALIGWNNKMQELLKELSEL